MSDLTPHARSVISDISARYGLSDFAVEQMARAVANGGGTMAQFNIPELGGSGQWMAGGMTMVGDMFNSGLQMTVQNLCGELSNAMANGAFFQAPPAASGGFGGGFSNWWPEELGQPASSGGQNSMRYAYFPQARRVAVDPGDGSGVVVLDALDHNIGGWGQQQSGWGDPFQGVSFSSQYGQFALSSLPRADGGGMQQPARPSAPPQQDWAPAPAPQSAPQSEPQSEPQAPSWSPEPAPAPAQTGAGGGEDILGTIERLARLRDAGALTEDEFAAKKAELLSRL